MKGIGLKNRNPVPDDFFCEECAFRQRSSFSNTKKSNYRTNDFRKKSVVDNLISVEINAIEMFYLTCHEHLAIQITDFRSRRINSGQLIVFYKEKSMQTF